MDRKAAKIAKKRARELAATFTPERAKPRRFTVFAAFTTGATLGFIGGLLARYQLPSRSQIDEWLYKVEHTWPNADRSNQLDEGDPDLMTSEPEDDTQR